MSSQPPAEALSVKELRSALKQANVSYDGCIEKSEFVALYVTHKLGAAQASPSPPLPPAVVDISEASTTPFKEMTSKQLKQHLVSRGISVDGCFEHVDFLERAERAASDRESSSQQQKQDSVVDRQRCEREEQLAAKRALADQQVAAERAEREKKREAARASAEADTTRIARPADGFCGYVVDMFGVRRGASCRDANCWRFDPPPLTAGRVLASSVCRTCGHSADAHEDYGAKKEQDEPDFVDEHGQCFRQRVEGGAGVRDSATYTYFLMKGVEPPPRDELLRHVRAKAPLANRTGAATATATIAAAAATASSTASATRASAQAPQAQPTATAAAAEAEAAALAARLRAARDVD